MVKKILLFLLLLLPWVGCHTDDRQPSQDRPGQVAIADLGKAGRKEITIKGETFAVKEGQSPAKKSFEELQALFLSAKAFDSILPEKIKQLKAAGLEPDLSEPATKRYLFSINGPGKAENIITVSSTKFVRVNFDNDILDNTDRYYTNGIRIDIISPFLRAFPLSRLMIPYRGTGTNYYGLSIVQKMYTPSTTKIGGILYGDRPYAASLYVGTFKITNDPVKRIRQTCELDLGVIGPYSLGGVVQKSFHAAVPTNNEPLGWVYQVQNDLILNYDFCLEKGVYSGRSFELNLSGRGAIGTLFTNFGGSMTIRAGRFNPYFVNLGIQQARMNHQQKLTNFQVYFFADLSGKVVGYDATLQGGLLNHSSVYTLPGDEISRLVLDGCAGITMSMGGFRLDVGQYLLSPEFHGGLWHHWVHAGITVAL
jgi:lipid A 3-O-deacylase